MEVQKVAARCLRLYDKNPTELGHTQTQRFLNPNWKGLNGNGSSGEGDQLPDPPLRFLMEQLATGDATLVEFFQDITITANTNSQTTSNTDMVVAKHSLLYWISSFRLAPRLYCKCCLGQGPESRLFLLKLFYPTVAPSMQCAQVRVAERSVEGRHSVIHRIQRRAPRASIGYISLEMRFCQLRKIAATNPACLKDMTSYLMGLERSDGGTQSGDVAWHGASLVCICAVSTVTAFKHFMS